LFSTFIKNVANNTQKKIDTSITPTATL